MGDVDRALRDPTLAAVHGAAVESLSKARFSGFGNSQTGNHTVMRFQVPGRKTVRVKVRSKDIDEYGSCGGESFKDALWAPMRDIFGMEPILGRVFEARKRREETTWKAQIEVVDHLLEACPRFAEELWSAVQRLRDSGDHRRKAGTHQVALAFRELRGPMSRALRNGATRDQIVAILDEELVRLVQEG